MIKKRGVVWAAVLWVAGLAQAAVDVNWQSTEALTAGATTISTQGTLEYAYNMGSANTYSVNLVSFRGTDSGGVTNLNQEGKVLFNPVDGGSTVGSFNSLSGDFGSLLDSAQWGTGNANNTITLGDLTDGQEYLVQVFSSDNRDGRNNVLRLDEGMAHQFDSVSTGATNHGAYVIGTFTADATEEAVFTFRYEAVSGNANLNAIQVRDVTPSTNTFVHPGIPLTLQDLDAIKAHLDVEPWKTGYDDMLASSYSSIDYVMQGPFAEVGHTSAENRNAWRSDMQAVHNMARLWYFTEEEAYAQKGRDILLSWANTHTNWLAGETYLDMGYNAHYVFEGADILRGTWPGWTPNDTEICKTYFEAVWWDPSHIAVPNPLRSANQGMSQFVAALGVAVFNDDEEKFEQCLQVFRSDAAAALRSSLPNGQIGDTGRDAHDQGQLKLMAWAAEVFWKQGVDVYSEYDNRLLAAAEYISRLNLLLDPPFIQAGTVYDIYPEIHTFEGPDFKGPFATYAIEKSMINMLYSAYVVRAGMRSPYLEKYYSYTTQDSGSFCYLKPYDPSTATPRMPLDGSAEVASVTSLNRIYMGDTSAGSASYDAGSGTWTVSGNGTRMWYDAVPDYHFAYLPVTGDATIIAKMTSLTGGSSEDARAGLAFSSDLTDDADMQAIVIRHPDSSDQQMYSFRRGDVAHSHQGNSGSRTYWRMADPKIPYWLKIERIGSRINCYSSPDGVSWSCGESADYDLGSTVYFGLAVSSDQVNNQSSVTFTDVRITGGDGGEAVDVPEAPFAIYASPGGDQVPLRWLESFEAERYMIWRSTKSGGPYTLIAQETGTSFVDTNVLFGTHYTYAVSAVNAQGESPLTSSGPFQFPNTDYYEGEDYDAQNGVGTEDASDFFGGKNLSNIHGGDWCQYNEITLGTGAVFRARIAGYNSDLGQMEVRLDSLTGTLLAVIDPIDTGGAQSWGTFETNMVDTVGVHDLYLVFTSGTNTTSSGFNLNWFDIVYPHISELDLGMDVTLTYDSTTNKLTNLGLITAWDSTSTHLKLADGSDLSTFNFSALGITSWKTTQFSDVAKITIWEGADLSGITLYADGNFGAGDRFAGANFSNLVWGELTPTADPLRFFSGGSGATSAANGEDAITFVGADLSLISGDARTVMINNLGGFDGTTPIGAKFDRVFITNSGWDKAALMAAGWQYMAAEVFAPLEAEDYDDQSGINTETCSEGGLNIAGINDGDWCAYYTVDFGSGVDEFQVRVASNTSGGNIEIRLGSTTGTLIGTCAVSGTGGWQNWVTETTPITRVTGVQDLYLVFTGDSGYLLNINWFTFVDTTPPAAPVGLEATPGAGAVHLRWTENSEPDLASYTVYRSTVSGSSYAALVAGLSSSDYVDAAVISGTTYYYVVSAVDVTTNESVYSSAVSATPTEIDPAEFLPEVSVSNGNFNVQFTGTVGRHYRMESTDDLTGTPAWQTVTDMVSLAASPFAVSTPATNSPAFYRVIGIP
ncbi:MAG: carbohydrate-binding protein [Pontiella sp.]